MHAYILVVQGVTNYQIPISNLAQKLGAKVMDFPLQKIEDVRNLNNLLRLEFTEPTLIVSPGIENATVDALNAFLKNLEEPQQNIYFALTTSSVRKVLPTIVSRCQVIKIINHKSSIINQQEIIDFLEMSQSQRLAFFDKIKDRTKAIELTESLIFFLHDKGELTNMELLLKTLTRLKANGNVNLQLTNLTLNWIN